jgi:micrococcal nuclease
MAGTALLGCLSILVLLSLCGFLAGIRRPQSLAPTPTITNSSSSPTRAVLPTGTATQISSSATAWILPTNTHPPTQRVRNTPTLAATAMAISTASTYAFATGQTDSTRSCVPDTSPQVGKVLDVVDGDTIRILLDGLVVKVKYIGIDAPESLTRLEYLGKEARARNRELVYGQDVLLYKDVSERDRFDRLLRYVFVGDRFINYELAGLGYADALDEAPDSACALLFAQAASSARDKSLGIWAPHTPMPEESAAAGNLIIFSVNKEAEFVDIQNVTETPIDLSGWKLVSEQGKQECKLGGTIQPSEIFRIFSGSKQPGYSCGFDKPIWDDTQPDPAILYNKDGNEVDRYP